MKPPRPWPADLAFDRAAKALKLMLEDGRAFAIPFELLRVESPSAEVQGHGGVGRALVPGKAGVGVTDALPVGRYAVRIVFDDGHDTGIYSWDYLTELGQDVDGRMAAYFARLAEHGLSRGA